MIKLSTRRIRATLHPCPLKSNSWDRMCTHRTTCMDQVTFIKAYTKDILSTWWWISNRWTEISIMERSHTTWMSVYWVRLDKTRCQISIKEECRQLMTTWIPSRFSKCKASSMDHLDPTSSLVDLWTVLTDNNFMGHLINNSQWKANLPSAWFLLAWISNNSWWPRVKMEGLGSKCQGISMEEVYHLVNRLGTRIRCLLTCTKTAVRAASSPIISTTSRAEQRVDYTHSLCWLNSISEKCWYRDRNWDELAHSDLQGSERFNKSQYASSDTWFPTAAQDHLTPLFLSSALCLVLVLLRPTPIALWCFTSAI